MVEWSQFWKDFSDAHKEMTAIIGVDNADKLLLGDVLGTLKLFYDMNKREHASQQQTLDTSDPDAPTAKQIAFAKKYFNPNLVKF